MEVDGGARGEREEMSPIRLSHMVREGERCRDQIDFF